MATGRWEGDEGVRVWHEVADERTRQLSMTQSSLAAGGVST